MSTNSSARKVARVAARSGPKKGPGGGPRQRGNWMFPLAIVAIVAVGVGVLVFARSRNEAATSNTVRPRAQLEPGKPSDHWHAAFGISACGKELATVPQPATDPLGIHTHGDGLIHIHPFSIRAAGKGATMAKFWDLVKLNVTDSGFRDPSTGKIYKAGETTCGGKPTEVVMAYWKNGAKAATTKPDKIYTSNFPSVRFTGDLSAYMLALVPKGQRDIPAPRSAAQVAALGSCDGKNPAPSCPSASGSGSATGGVTVPPGAVTVPSGSSGSATTEQSGQGR